MDTNQAPKWLWPILKLAGTARGGRFFVRFATPIDRFLMGSSGDKISMAGLGIPALMLISRGRRSGQQRSTPLLYLPWQDNYIVMASNGGQDRAPAWYYNLSHTPQATVLINGQRQAVLAEETHGALRDALWSQIITYNPGFANYQARVKRTIPVMLLKPLPSDD